MTQDIITILQVHNRYQYTGGEDIVVAMEHDLLQSHGHRVELYSVTNDAIRGTLAKVRAAYGTHYSAAARKQFAEKLASVKPDIVHVHNFFPLVSPSIYDACQEAGVPVVQTLHNYRLICPGALLERNGQICELCLHGNAYQAVYHRCYRGSGIGSLVVAHMVEYHRTRDTWRNKVDRFIVLSEFARSKFVEAGFPPEKIVVKPIFVQDPKIPAPSLKREGALYAGRLSHEKGIKTLLEAWRGIDLPLRIAGEGPMLEKARRLESPTISFLGRITRADVLDEMGKAAFLILPSECYENFPLVIIEAFAAGLPVIVSQLGSMAEIVENGVTGLYFTAGDAGDLAAKVHWAMDHKTEMESMGLAARKTYLENYTADTNYNKLIGIYNELLSSRMKQ